MILQHLLIQFVGGGFLPEILLFCYFLVLIFLVEQRRYEEVILALHDVSLAIASVPVV
jgi:hypothetical protein